MQLFIPTLITVVIAAILAFFIIPRTGALILASVSLLALIAAGVHHYNLFYSEYMLSTWQNGLAANASFLILGLAILFIIGAIFYMFTGGGSVGATGAVNTVQEALTAPFEAMSNSMEKAINSPPGNSSGGIGNVFSNAFQTVTGAANAMTGAVSGAVNAVANAPKNVMKVANNAVGNLARRSNLSPLIPGTSFRASEI